MKSTHLVVFASMLAIGCGPDATADKSAASSSGSAHPTAAVTASATATATATSTATATATASAAPSASASASSSAALVPADAPAADAPTEAEFAALDKEIAVRASGEQKCSTKVLNGWFEMSCGEDEKLIRATRVEVVSGFDPKSAVLEANEGKTLRWVGALPASGERAQARFYGAKMHEIWLTLDHTDKGWKGALTSNKPE